MTVLTVILLSCIVTQAILMLVVLGLVRRQSADIDRLESEVERLECDAAEWREREEELNYELDEYRW